MVKLVLELAKLKLIHIKAFVILVQQVNMQAVYEHVDRVAQWGEMISQVPFLGGGFAPAFSREIS